MKERKNSRISIILSIVLHGALLVFLFFNNFDPQPEEAKTVEIEWVQLEDLPKNQPEKLQIVQQDDKSINDKTPDKNYKLSKNNQDLLKETKSQKQGEFKNRKNKFEGKKVAAASKKPQPKKKFSLDSFKPKLFDDQYSPSKLAPSPKPAINGSEVSQNDDYLNDVVIGAETLLRTREFVYYSYYNRIKKKLRFHWEPRIKQKIVKILKRGRKLAAVSDKITRLVITLDTSGSLVRVQVKNASGYNDLDDAAIEAFEAAAPFPNPPKGIVSGKGMVEINWDFVLET